MCGLIGVRRSPRKDRGGETEDQLSRPTCQFGNTFPPKADIGGPRLHVRFVPILLQKSVAGFFGQ
jgi:hypothetical protein